MVGSRLADCGDCTDDDKSFQVKADLQTTEVALIKTVRFWRRQTLG
ncbi:MAG: hypothetical protein IIZ93_02995 [Acidaminococcaceae bacterium]|nr:hypothetical protein [Succiniclasticum ruminis]MBQ1777106.1 hypothetical protein [Acidaminococcaceae bacterium]